MFKKITTAWALHRRVAMIVALIVLIIYPFLFSNQYLVTVATLGGVYSILAMSLNLISGFMGSPPWDTRPSGAWAPTRRPCSPQSWAGPSY